MDTYQGTNQQTLVQQTSLQPKSNEIPQSTDTVIIFPKIVGKEAYDSGSYDSALTDGRMSKEEVTQFLQSIEAVTTKKLSGVNCIAGIFGILMLASIIYLIYVDITSLKGAGPIALSIVIYFVVWIFLLAVLGCVIEKKTEEAIQIIKPTLDANNVNLRSVGLRWNLPKAFPKWVELWKDYKAQPEFYPMSNSDPQSNTTYPNMPNMSYPAYGDPNMGQYQNPQQQYPQATQNYYSEFGQNTYGNYQQNQNNYYPPQQNYTGNQGF